MDVIAHVYQNSQRKLGPCKERRMEVSIPVLGARVALGPMAGDRKIHGTITGIDNDPGPPGAAFGDTPIIYLGLESPEDFARLTLEFGWNPDDTKSTGIELPTTAPPVAIPSTPICIETPSTLETPAAQADNDGEKTASDANNGHYGWLDRGRKS